MKDLKTYLLEEVEPKLIEPCITFDMIGAKCRLGAMHPSYDETLWRLINQSNPGLGRRGPVGFDSEVDFVKRISERGASIKVPDSITFCIFTLDHKLPIGTIGLYRKEDAQGKFFWTTGTFIGRPWQGQKIGTDAKMLLLHWVSKNFTHEEVSEILSTVYSINPASAAVQKKCGYELVREDKHVVRIRNGHKTHELILRVIPGAHWLEKKWNPYASKHGLEVWS